jgi:uncharacterized protein (TIGR02996 family)
MLEHLVRPKSGFSKIPLRQRELILATTRLTPFACTSPGFRQRSSRQLFRVLSEGAVDEEAFLEAIRAEPGDDTLRLVYADWLEEQGDPRAAYLRLIEEIAARLRHVRDWTDLESSLSELSAACSTDWRKQAGKRFDAVLESVDPERKLDTVGAVRHQLGLGLADAKHLVEAAPIVMRRGILLEESLRLKQALEFGAWHEGYSPPESRARCTVVIREAMLPGRRS